MALSAFWEVLSRPLLEAVGARRVVEVGVDRGDHSRKLSAFCAEVGGHLDMIDPAPRESEETLRQLAGAHGSWRRRPSLEALHEVVAPDVVFLDGDHNWYTVYQELRLLEERFGTPSNLMPVVVVHDVGWPYGRRDLYYDPATVPEAHRQPFERAGLTPGRSDLTPDGGMNAGLWNASHEGGPRNGVLTAVEDFLADRPGRFVWSSVPCLFGYGILVSGDRLAELSALRRLLDELAIPERLAQLMALAESMYVDQCAQTQELARVLTNRASRGERARHERPRLSVVVVIYDMGREAPRTLTSLSAAYQEELEESDYEVIVVENGSPEPLPAEVVESLPANFRYTLLDPATPSPAAAANEGLRQASGDVIGLVIDGARMATPGLLHYALKGAGLYPRPIVYSLSWLLGPKIQNLSVTEGYDPAEEDRLLEQIRWPEDGYRLFEVGVLAGSNSGGWFHPNMESNALFLPRELWDELGGVDEGFDVAGGGFVNPDVYRRACGLPETELVVLLGEATFHQVHGGIATSSSPQALVEKTVPWLEQYRALRGMDFERPRKRPVILGHLPPQAEPHIEVLTGLRWP